METLKYLKAILTALTNLFGVETVKQEIARGEWPENVGPAPEEHPVVPITAVLAATTSKNDDFGNFTAGKWSLAKQVPMHPGRIGRAIQPRALIVHTTDMAPGTFNALVKSWTSQPGKGNGAHFLLGKSEATGIVQFCPTVMNANHAGGPNCGYLKQPDGTHLHPNLIGVGVEIDNAGRLKKDAKGWYQPSTGYRFAPENVFIDEKGRGWEKLTEYQKAMLRKLWLALSPTLKAFVPGTVIVPNGSYTANGSEWAHPVHMYLLGHASTNALNKTDPGPEAMALINTWTLEG